MRRALALVFVACLVGLAETSPAGAAADASGLSAAPPAQFHFFGAGFGHGLGMSQWGAYGLAKQGWNASRILRHYYSNTRISTADTPPKSLRIGLVQGASKLRLDAEAGDVQLVLDDPTSGQEVGTIPEGQTWIVREDHQAFTIVDGSGAVVATVGDPGTDLFVQYPSGRVRIPEALHAYNRGRIEIELAPCADRCKLRAVLTTPPQEYLYGLGEVPSTWPMAAMKAQAIAARTYAFSKAASGQHRAGCDCALYASSYDQVYAGWDKEAGPDGDRWVEAVDTTDDEVITYQGTPIEAFYMSSSGGYTEDNENVWGGTPIPYLRGVCDPGDYTSANPNATWTLAMSADDVTHDLRLGIGTVVGFTNVQRGVSGRIITTTVNGEKGAATVSGGTLRADLALRDDRVWIDADRLVTGSIREKYDADNCAPGLPTSRQVQVAGGDRQTFEDATIYSSDATGAHSLSGDVLAFFLEKGGPGGKLGFPTSDVVTFDNGGTRATFEHGAIRCTPSGACSIP